MPIHTARKRRQKQTFSLILEIFSLIVLGPFFRFGFISVCIFLKGSFTMHKSECESDVASEMTPQEIQLTVDIE